MLSVTTISFYGKLPWMGDFIARNMVFEQQQRVDAWLVNSFTALKIARPDWLEKYLSAPVWNFVLPAGVWQDVAVIGAVMPSVDKVGRYFPFVVFSPLDKSINLHLSCFQFSHIAAMLPEFLEYELLPDVALDIVANCLQHATKVYSTDQLSIINEENLRTLIAAGKSYWWCTNHEITTGFVCDDTQVELFARLFANDF